MRTTLLCMLAVVYSAGLDPVAGNDAHVSFDAVDFTVQTRDESDARRRESLTIDPARTAVVVIDMWDRHWCETYTRRVANLVPRMNATLVAARQLGMTIVFAPSDVVDFYESAPQRQAMRQVPEHPEPKKVAGEWPAPPHPTDHCECGPAEPCKNKVKVWSRQQPDLLIAENDLIGDCNNGRELLNLCAERGIDTLIYCGVASNMCVQYRSMGIRNMKCHGLRVLVIADLVEAITSNGVDAEGNKDLNFTPAGGSARIQRHLERYLAPTFESRQLLRAAGGAAANADTRPHVVFVAAEHEYDSRRTLPEFAKKYLGNTFRCTFLEASGDEGTGRDDISGLESLCDADCLVLSARRRSLPVVQMDHLERYLRSGKPLVALRTSVVAFQTRNDPQPGYVVWDRFDQEVIGSNYRGYNSRARETGSDVWVAPEATGHPILQGVAPAFHSPMWIYYQTPLSDSTTVLLWGRWSAEETDEPVAWTHVWDGTRVFYTSLGHPGDFENESFNRLLQNAVRWAIEPQ